MNHGLPPTARATMALAWGGSPNKVMALLRNPSVKPPGWTPYLFDGNVWTAKPFNDPNCVFRDARFLFWAGGNGNVVYAFSTLLKMQRSDNAASAANCKAIRFKDISPPDSLRAASPYDGAHTIAVHPRDANRLLVAEKTITKQHPKLPGCGVSLYQ